VLNAIEGCNKPVIAAINGFCFGGGFELALACHWRYASENAQIGLTEASLGIIPGYGGTQRLARLTGKGVALEMIATGARIGPADALAKGIVNRVTTAADLIPTAKAAVAEMAKCGPLAVKFAIEAVNRGLDVTLPEGLRIEADLFGVISASEDMREGLNAFLEKRPPNFKNQ
jgi:enoyl-CoA hydratase